MAYTLFFAFPVAALAAAKLWSIRLQHAAAKVPLPACEFLLSSWLPPLLSSPNSPAWDLLACWGHEMHPPISLAYPPPPSFNFSFAMGIITFCLIDSTLLALDAKAAKAENGVHTPHQKDTDSEKERQTGYQTRDNV